MWILLEPKCLTVIRIFIGGGEQRFAAGVEDTNLNISSDRSSVISLDNGGYVIVYERGL